MTAFRTAVLKAKAVAKKAFSSITVEPLMLLDGLAFSNMHVYIENLQMDRVCRVSAGYSQEVCSDLKVQPDVSVLVQQKYSVFALYNGIIAAALPLFFILFMGAWSDKYGRKVPLIAVQVGHVLHAAGYLLASMVPSWPAEFLLLVTLLDTLGGGAVSFLTAANSYIGDVSSEESRTSRVGLANSIWFLGGPAGTLLGTYLYNKGGYLPLFATSLTFSVMAVFYVIFFLPESHGPFAKKIDTETTSQKAGLALRDSVAAVYGIESKSVNDAGLQRHEVTLGMMIKDFFSPRRILDSFRSTLRKREGNTRALILLLIFTSLLRRLTRSPYVFAFTRHVLGWEATDYSLWVTYKNLMATTGSLVAVPLLCGRFGMPDNILAMVGAISGILEYVVYGCVSESQPNLIWVAPIAALLLNSCTIAQRSMMTKFVTKDEIGKVSSVLGALDGMMPMVNSAVFTSVYHATVSVFPAAHFFLGASFSVLMMAMFCIIISGDKTREYDVEGAQHVEYRGPIKDKSLVVRKDSMWLATPAAFGLEVVHYHEMSSRVSTIPGISISQETSNVRTDSDGSAQWLKKLSHGLKYTLEKFLKIREQSSPTSEDSRSNPSEQIPNISSLFVNITRITNGTLIPIVHDDSEKKSISCQITKENSDNKCFSEV